VIDDQGRVDPVLEHRAVLDQVQAKAGELALLSHPRVGQPARTRNERASNPKLLLQSMGVRPKIKAQPWDSQSAFRSLRGSVGTRIAKFGRDLTSRLWSASCPRAIRIASRFMDPFASISRFALTAARRGLSIAASISAERGVQKGYAATAIQSQGEHVGAR
jgi:hypothetical protein